ncbi:hypothetical protein LY10_03338, partial [Planktotalea frisia]
MVNKMLTKGIPNVLYFSSHDDQANYQSAKASRSWPAFVRARNKLFPMEWFGKIIIGPKTEPFDFALCVIRAG